MLKPTKGTPTMKLKPWSICALAAALPLLAAAQDARTTRPLNLRAGPGSDYPVVVHYGPGAPLSVQGCTSGYGWCDVIGPDGSRGWVYATGVSYAYQSTYVPIITYGAVIGVPILSFVIGDYWGRYYAGRPWYGNRGRWEHRPPPLPGPGFRPGFRPPLPGTPGFHGGPGFRPGPPGHGPGLRPGGMQRPPGGGGPRPGGGHGGRGGPEREGGHPR
jgi:uncharacterized protein YraI